MGLMKQRAMEDDGFTDFLQEIIDMEALEGAALGITKIVIDKGREALSTKQDYVFQKQVLDEFTVDECKRCSCDIPWCEMSSAYDNGGFCSYCNHMMNKDD